MDALVAHPRGVTAWHGASAVCMVLMLVAAVPGWFAATGLALFAAGLAWCGVQLARRASPAAYLRLGVCCLAMVLMLWPRDPVAPTPAGHMGHAGHAGHEMAVPAAGPSVGAVLVALVALALLAVVVLAVRAVASGRGTSRLGPACEGVLAGSMAVMLVGLV
jgi:hypothetical protein